MGRPPCCDKVGIKKGPWTPEEDIVLVTYIQEHGPGNWRSVPTNTGLLRCSKSCRLRWTNYLRPGIKRGNFTPHEEGMIIHLQALLGNKWAAIATYLPQRTDNDIKNYWNTHLKKKLKKFQSSNSDQQMGSSNSTNYQFLTKNFTDKMSLENNIANPSSSTTQKFNQGSSTYASSTENISRLLEGWMRSAPKSNNSSFMENMESDFASNQMLPKFEKEGGHSNLNIGFESILCFDHNLNAIGNWDGASSDSNLNESDNVANENEKEVLVQYEERIKGKLECDPPMSFLENWFLGESGNHVEEMMELPPIF